MTSKSRYPAVNVDTPDHWAKMRDIIEHQIDIFITRGGQRLRNLSLNHVYNNALVRQFITFETTRDILVPLAAKFELEIYNIELELAQSKFVGDKRRRIVALEKKRRQQIAFQLPFIFNRFKNKIKRERRRLKKLNTEVDL
jgi:hypothetical protein